MLSVFNFKLKFYSPKGKIKNTYFTCWLRESLEEVDEFYWIPLILKVFWCWEKNDPAILRQILKISNSKSVRRFYNVMLIITIWQITFINIFV
jgi:hypothetical protein